MIAISQIVLMPFFSFLPLPLWVFVPLVFVWPAFGWSFMVPQQARLVSQAPQRQSVVLAMNAAALYLGAAIGSAASGVVLEMARLQALGVAGAIAMALAMILLFASGRWAPPPR